VSDAEAVELTVMDTGWQLVLDCPGADDPAFAQGALQQFGDWMGTHASLNVPLNMGTPSEWMEEWRRR